MKRCSGATPASRASSIAFVSMPLQYAFTLTPHHSAFCNTNVAPPTLIYSEMSTEKSHSGIKRAKIHTKKRSKVGGGNQRTRHISNINGALYSYTQLTAGVIKPPFLRAVNVMRSHKRCQATRSTFMVTVYSHV